MKIFALSALLVLTACSAAPALISAPLRMVAADEEEIWIPGDALPDSAWTSTQCFAAPYIGGEPPAGSDLISVGKNGDRIFMDKHGNVSLWRVRDGYSEVCLVVNQTGGSL